MRSRNHRGIYRTDLSVYPCWIIYRLQIMFHALCQIYVFMRSCFVSSAYVLDSVDDKVNVLTSASKDSGGSVVLGQEIGSVLSNPQTQETTHQVGSHESVCLIGNECACSARF
jgi:hypothetical protein